jgi:hypothetical protein
VKKSAGTDHSLAADSSLAADPARFPIFPVADRLCSAGSPMGGMLESGIGHEFANSLS